MKKTLQTSEWVLTATFFLLLTSLFFISRVHDHRKNAQLATLRASRENQLEVKISGEVANPGVFYASEGTRLGDVVKKSRPKRFADCRQWDLDRPLETSLEIFIPKLKEIAVRIEGEVAEALDVKLPAGSRICDLKTKIQFTDEADLTIFKRRRLLKDGEVIVVSKKTAVD